MSIEKPMEEHVMEPVLSPVDRISEMLFGLFMALTFVGAISVADARGDQIQSMFKAALGCNLAWGLVDAIMYLVRTVTERGRALTLVRNVREATDAAAGCRLIENSLTRSVAVLVSPTEIEAIRERMVALPSVPERPRLHWHDLRAALAIFLIVVAATFPVVLPFLLFQDLAVAKHATRIIALVMLFMGGLVLGRFAGYGSWKVGLMMTGIGVMLIVTVIALGG
jgi:hypothetical protein